MRRALVAAAVLVASFVSARVAAERLPVHVFSTADGVAGGRVFDAVEDARGFLWFATSDGVSRFDGAAFERFDRADGVPDYGCAAVAETPDGAIWVATQRGVARLDPDDLGIRPRFTAVLDGAASAFFIDRAGALWIGGAGLWRVAPGARVADEVDLPDGEYVYAMAQDAQDSLWLASDHGVYRRTAQGVLSKARYTPPGFTDDRVMSILYDRAGRLWFGAAAMEMLVLVPPTTDAPITTAPSLWEGAVPARAPDGSLRSPSAPGEIVRFGPDDGFDYTGVRRGLLEDSRGVLWIGGMERNARLRDGRVEELGPAHGLPAESLAPMLEDRAGNVWLGGNTVGVVRVTASGAVAYDQHDGLATLGVSQFLEDDAGNLYATTWREGHVLHRLDGERWTPVVARVPPDHGGGWGTNQIVARDDAGGWWYATGTGVAHYPPVARIEELAAAEPEWFGVDDGLPGSDVYRLYRDARGDVWISTLSGTGLVRWDHALDRIVPVAGLPDAGALSFAEDRTGNLWIGFQDGRLARWPDGLVLDAADGGIGALVVDARGRLWAAARGGVLRVDDPSAPAPAIVRYTVAEGLSTELARSIADDARGRIYVGGARGIDRIDPTTGDIVHFDTTNGLPGDHVMTMYRDRHGDLWVGTTLGVARLRPDDHVAPAPADTFLMSVIAGGQARPLAMGGAAGTAWFSLAHDEAQLDIAFTAPSVAAGAPVLFQTRLDGADAAWSAPSAAREVRYAHLAPGSYRFWVRAVTAGGVASAPASLGFEIQAPVWRRPWFLALVAAALALIGWRLYRMRVARLLVVERERTRIATDLHDDLGASLSRIAILSEVAARRAPDGEVAATVSEIARGARELVDVAGDIVWATDPRRDDLASLLTRVRAFAGDVLESRDIAWSMTAPPAPEQIRLGPDARRDVFLVIKEAVNNAARHAHASRVEIEVAIDHRHLRASITDDGRGIAAGRDDSGNGLGNMRRRARAARGTLTIEAAPGGGTRIVLRVPLA